MSRATEDSRESPEYGHFYFPVYEWVKDDPALELKVEEPTIQPQPDYVFKVNGELSAQSCPTKAEEKTFAEEEAQEELVVEAEEQEKKEEESRPRKQKAAKKRKKAKKRSNRPSARSPRVSSQKPADSAGTCERV